MPPPTTSVAGWIGTCSGFERFVMQNALDATGDDRLRLLGRGDFVGVHPRVLLADRDQLAQIGVQSRALAGIAEGLFVQMRRAGGDYHARQLQFLDVLLDHVLTGAGTHELIVAGDDYAARLQMLSRPLSDLLHIHHTSDIAAAVTDVDADTLVTMMIGFLGHGITSSSAGHSRHRQRLFFLLSARAPGVRRR